MALGWFLGSECYGIGEDAVVHTSVVAFFVANYMVCNMIYEVKLRPRHAPQALQPTSKPGRPPIQSID